MAATACSSKASADDGGPAPTPVAEVWSVVIVDDHPIMCDALASAFAREEDFRVVATGGSAEQAMLAARECMPDLLIVDLNMPGGGLNAIRTVSARFPAVRILVVTATDDDFTLTEAFRAGASGYVVKGIGGDDLVALARCIINGESQVPPVLAERLLKSGVEYRAGTSDTAIAGRVELSKREVQILSLIATGRSNAEIAVEVGMAESTVKNHVTNILHKLHVRNRVEAALVALSQSVSKF